VSFQYIRSLKRSKLAFETSQNESQVSRLQTIFPDVQCSSADALSELRAQPQAVYTGSALV
jgi:hypothetical protein